MIGSMGRLKSSSSTKPRKQQYSHLGQCRKHPKHRQSPGVCSLCLTEKLSRVSTRSSSSSSSTYSSGYSRARLAYYYSDSISSSDDDDDYSYASSPGSPVLVPVPGHRRIASDVRKGNKGIIVNGLMGKNRSMAVVACNEEEDGKLKGTGMSISGFWSKLVGPKRRTSHLTKMVSESNPLPVY